MARIQTAFFVLFGTLAASVPATAQQEPAGTSDAAAAKAADPFVESCMSDLRELSDELSREGYTLGGRHMRSLFDAASVFASNGMEDACGATIDGIRTYAEKLRDEDPRSDSGQAWTAGDLQGAVANAEPVSGDVTAAGQFMDDLVLSSEGERLGTVDDVISRQGTQYLLVGGDGFLDIDETYRPIKLDRFRRLDPDTLVLPTEETAFEQAPSFDVDTLDLGEWAADVEAWWDENVSAN